ncbi:polysaccharide pyruvyl transferase family protein [Halobacillus sp. A5]|uniref:polysaccharide pyruvyl transferase family protein n=1 Tax=Halobacillus sp. A5 TaxID=2880263 RepID=UPI0020A69B54|nr:polysaccharide pyruvyl transferase family protein [Halobacillus sp. A5]MCP3029187.1 polysaccharide pyruvyl transferase family protein [Halobacillus sp. A5]
MKRKRILVNAYYNINLGDDLFLKVLFERYPNVQWELLTTKKKYELIFKEYKNVNLIKQSSLNVLVKKVRFYRRLDNLLFYYFRYSAYVYIGGSIFMEGKGWEKFLKERMEVPLKFKKSKKPIFIIGANFGPFKDSYFINEHREYFKLFDDICFRDKYSYNIFSNEQNIRLAPDVIFGLKNDSVSYKEKSVGFSIINLVNREGLKKYESQYKDKIVELIKRYIEKGFEVKLFSFCKKEGDLEAIKQIIESLRFKHRRKIKIVSYEGNIDNFLNEFKKCEIIFGSRFHSIILAFLFNQSVFPIIYSEKTYNILNDLEMTSNYSYIRDISKINVEKIIDEVSRNKLINNNIFEKSKKQFKYLDKFVD